MQDSPSSRNARSNVAIGAIIGGGLFATALGCGIIALGPLAIPIGIGAVLAGGAGGASFQNIKPGIDAASSKVSSCVTKLINNINIPSTTPGTNKPSKQVENLLRILHLETKKGDRYNFQNISTK